VKIRVNHIFTKSFPNLFLNTSPKNIFPFLVIHKKNLYICFIEKLIRFNPTSSKYSVLSNISHIHDTMICTKISSKEVLRERNVVGILEESEDLSTKITHLYFERNMIHIRQGKGRKDRNVPLDEFTIHMLRHNEIYANFSYHVISVVYSPHPHDL